MHELFDFTDERRIVCPLPNHWQDLYKLLCKTIQPKEGQEFLVAMRFPALFSSVVGIPPPLILAGWWYSDNRAKKARFLTHIGIADECGVIHIVENFVFNLGKRDFHYENKGYVYDGGYEGI